MLDLLRWLLPVTTAVIGAATCAPQLVRIWRTGSAAGVSVWGWATDVLSYAAWVLYALWRGDTGAFISMLVPGVLCTAVAVLAARRGGDFRDPSLPLRLVAFAVFAAVLGGMYGWSVLLALTAVPVYLPSIYSAWTAHSIRGVSAWTWWLCVLYGISWGSYGAVMADRVIVLNGVVNIGLAGAILAAVWARPNARHR